MVVNIGVGDYPIAPLDVIKSVLHLPSASADHDFIVWEPFDGAAPRRWTYGAFVDDHVAMQGGTAVAVKGHTDTVGSAEANQILSERRAAAVRDYLINKFGVDPSRLVAVGLGQTQLLVPTPDNTPNAQNRRVQVVNIGSDGNQRTI